MADLQRHLHENLPAETVLPWLKVAFFHLLVSTGGTDRTKLSVVGIILGVTGNATLGVPLYTPLTHKLYIELRMTTV
jgi:hypothetical protein